MRVTLFFKDKVYEEGAVLPEGASVGDRVPPASLEVVDWGIEGAALIAAPATDVVAIFPLAELESAVVFLGGEASVADEGAAGSDAEVTDEGSILAPDFTGSGGAGEGADS